MLRLYVHEARTEKDTLFHPEKNKYRNSKIHHFLLY